jgi:hypothetical protein
METNGNKTSKNKQNKFVCENCDYITSRKSNYDAHLLTLKHQNGNKWKQMETKQAKTSKNKQQCNEGDHNTSLTCLECSKSFKCRSGLWKHNHKYHTNKDIKDNLTIETLLEIIKDNNDFKDFIMKQNASMTNIIADVVKNGMSANNIINSNNKSFNLNVFLNETCKDAMNIDEFVSSIKVNIEDLEHTGQRGYVEGISNIFMKNLNNLEHHLRPLHCSDTKREVIYIKNNNEWVKEVDDKPILTNAIKMIANENIKQIPIWKNLHPGCTLSESNKNNTYLRIVSNSMCGLTSEESINNVKKIVSNISKGASIDKKLLL